MVTCTSAMFAPAKLAARCEVSTTVSPVCSRNYPIANASSRLDSPTHPSSQFHDYHQDLDRSCIFVTSSSPPSKKPLALALALALAFWQISCTRRAVNEISGLQPSFGQLLLTALAPTTHVTQAKVKTERFASDSTGSSTFRLSNQANTDRIPTIRREGHLGRRWLASPIHEPNQPRPAVFTVRFRSCRRRSVRSAFIVD